MKRNNATFKASILIVVAILIGITIASLSAASAQSPTSTPSPTTSPAVTPTPSPTPPPTPFSDIRVKEVYRLGHEDKNDPKRNSAGIGDIIVVQVENLQKLVNQSNCIDEKQPGQKVEGCQEQEIALFLDGRKIKGIVRESVELQPNEEKLQFHLQRNADSDEAWADLLGSPSLGRGFFLRPTAVSVGLENEYPVSTDVKDKSAKGDTNVKGDKKFELVRVNLYLFWIYFGGLAVLLYFILRLAKRSNIVRDYGEQPAAADKQKPFSLARCQMAFWFFWVIASFLFILLITGADDTITATVLSLIGIGAGTALGSAVLDAGKQEETANQRSGLGAEQLTLKTDIAALDAQIATVPPPANLSELEKTRTTKQTRLDLVEEQIEELSAKTAPRESQGFLKDVLNDAHGVSFHRFQMFVWTIVLGFIFIFSVWERLSMPELGATLLALQGISAGTYLGFKIPEKN
ncbi:MAG: hypothetical protein ACKVQW_06610 [Pyrinomonadaceae bacterium]